MKNQIQPISSLRDTNKLEKDLKDNGGTLFITKNGYLDLVLLSPDKYDSLNEDKSLLIDNSKPFVSSETIRNIEQSDPMGFVRVCARSLNVSVCGIEENTNEIISAVKEADEKNVDILVLPELCVTGYTCQDLFLTSALLDKSDKAIDEIRENTKDFDVLFAIGAPVRKGNVTYNCGILIYRGEILGVVPKMNVPNYSEFYEMRHFACGPEEVSTISIRGNEYPFGSKLMFQDERYVKIKIGVEICEDVWVPNPPSTGLALNGCDIILNLSASNEIVGKREYRSNLVKMTSARTISAYVYASSGDGESTTDIVFSSHNIISENGNTLAETAPFKMEVAMADIDVERILSERRKMNTFFNANDPSYKTIYFDKDIRDKDHLLRHYSKNPFIPESEEVDFKRVQSILDIQAAGLIKRLKTVRQKKAIIGLSGGLDSTLALLVTVEAFKKLNYDLKGIYAVTLPAFGTSTRTHDNAKDLAECLGVTFDEVNIKDSVVQHLKDIRHDINDHNVTYENAQARERTQVLMDMSGDLGALMVGTGDLSELCLGWCTYNGDHMSNYGVNASIPKTLVRYLCLGYAKMHPEAARPLLDIIDTPISPELLPTGKDGQIEQKTEDKIGPYELHDFFIFHFMRNGYSPKKLFRIAKVAHGDTYSDETIKKWLKEFFRRFFMNQFKRSTLPDGPKVGSVSVSPRGDWRMPSDATSYDFLKEIETL
ncbi:MAG: NAD(+) synthase [Bacilli bacterium]|nr:NAD(+) synthase [Bacilli bacterium]